ncbi:type II toxin-antitoxin system RelE/ParE family toxin [Archaeoglobus sp.]|uniref:type II toxin-antitoxin system RelE family toxin n=1 Tax=Archaeoglobus sp. TaxID=1872626 RepID=UPI0024AB2A6B|nr:type II toxin-antitoxin system RelE/ParE family toxin [Archaeoglobus sp.]MDI3498276.1 hypothetical protein [Archaeoglobus sp.]
MNEVLIHKKFLDGLDSGRRSKVLDAIRMLKDFPIIRADIKKIGPKTYRLRKGEIRIIFDFDIGTNRVFVKFADFRGRVYKN